MRYYAIRENEIVYKRKPVAFVLNKLATKELIDKANNTMNLLHVLLFKGCTEIKTIKEWENVFEIKFENANLETKMNLIHFLDFASRNTWV